MLASMYGHKEVCELLVDKGGDTNAGNIVSGEWDA